MRTTTTISAIFGEPDWRALGDARDALLRASGICSRVSTKAWKHGYNRTTIIGTVSPGPDFRDDVLAFSLDRCAFGGTITVDRNEDGSAEFSLTFNGSD